MQTGENEQGLRKIIDLTRLISIAVLSLHVYYQFYTVFDLYGFSSVLSDRLLVNLERTGLFKSFNQPKCIALGFAIISLFGASGKKNEKIKFKSVGWLMTSGLTFFFSSKFLYKMFVDQQALCWAYLSVTGTGYLLFLMGGTHIARIIKVKLSDDVFNSENETFPQEERLLENEYSINLPATYNLKGNRRKSWINIINPFRGILVMGSPGSGKTHFIIQHIIRQHIRKGFSMFIYDFKFDDLTKIAYEEYLQRKKLGKEKSNFFVIDFDDVSQSHRCNPLDPSLLSDITDAAESSRTIMLGLNHEWIKKHGDFFVESPINFVTALIWFLRKYKGGKFCTLPHVIELAQVEYDKLFSVLKTEPEIEALINPFITAYTNGANEQLEGQIASAKISLGKLASEKLYYVLSGNDFTLDINNPNDPKIFCIGSNPQKSQTYGAVISLYVTAMTRIMNKKNCLKSSLVIDEFPTIYLHGIDNLIATARSNKIATTLAVQDASQLKLHYGKELADVILNIMGNVISGQVSGDTAKQLSERFGKILQPRQSLSINRNDTSVTQSKQLEMALPTSKISSLSSGEFVGLVADNPDQRIQLKAFCARFRNSLQTHTNTRMFNSRKHNLKNGGLSAEILQRKAEINYLVDQELTRIMDTPEYTNLIVKRI
jgi:YWFCY protein/Type IV secretory system Conjugative DNA transfer